MTLRHTHDLHAYVCPFDGSDLDWREDAVRCEGEHRFDVVGSIPRFVAAGPPASRKSSRRFGYKWQVFHEINEDYVRNFLDEIRPLDEDFFRDKVILDAGCGIGIPSYCLSRMGARRIHAADVSPAVEHAQRNNRESGLVEVVQADIYRMPYRAEYFDVVVCVAVLQHLPDHGAALDALLRVLKPGGTLILWVYGREGNELVGRLVEPLRRHVTRRLPLALLLGISYVIALPFHLLLLPLYRALGRLGLGSLPMQAYLTYRAGFRFSNNLEMIFDQLLAPESHLFSRAELETLLTRESVESQRIRRHNENSWTVFAVKRSRAPGARERRPSP